MRRAVVSSLLLCLLVASLNASVVHSPNDRRIKSSHFVRTESYNTFAQNVITRWSQSAPSIFEGISELTIYKKNSQTMERVACIEFDDTCFKEGPQGTEFAKLLAAKKNEKVQITGAGSSWLFKKMFNDCKVYNNQNKKDYSLVVCESVNHIFAMEGWNSKESQFLASIEKAVRIFKEVKQ